MTSFYLKFQQGNKRITSEWNHHSFCWFSRFEEADYQLCTSAFKSFTAPFPTSVATRSLTFPHISASVCVALLITSSEASLHVISLRASSRKYPIDKQCKLDKLTTRGGCQKSLPASDSGASLTSPYYRPAANHRLKHFFRVLTNNAAKTKWGWGCVFLYSFPTLWLALKNTFNKQYLHPRLPWKLYT